MDETNLLRLELNIRFIIFRWIWVVGGVVALTILPPVSLYFGQRLPIADGYLITLLLIVGVINIFLFLLAINIEYNLKKSLLYLLSISQIIIDLVVALLFLYFALGASYAFAIFILPIIEATVLFGLLPAILISLGASLGSSSLYYLLSTNRVKTPIYTEFLIDNPYLYHNLITWFLVFISSAFFVSYNYETVKPIYIVKRILRKKDSREDKAFFSSTTDTKINEKLVNKMNKLSRVLYTKDLEIKMLKKQLANLDQAKSKFISVTTHQMRTPLSAIKWTLNMILSGQLGEVTEEQKEFLQKGYDSTQKMIVIVNNLLNLNQRESLRDDYSFSLVNLEELVKDTMSEFANQVESKKIDFVFKKSAGQIPKIEVDQAKIKMVLENLFDNAIKYTPHDGQVVVSLSDKNLNTANSQVEISVTDSGIGIPEEEQKKIFHKFFRASNAVLQEPDGSGIGLYISKDIVEKHHGTLWFESQAGKGTTFHLLLPLNQVESKSDNDNNDK